MLSRAQLVQHRVHRGLALDTAWLDAQMQAIGEAITRLNVTIDEMSDVARLQVGQALDLQLEDLDVGALVHTVAGEYSTEAGAPRVDVHAPAEPVLVCADRARLDVQTQEQQAVITVRDQGVGIPADELPHLFTRFFRASTARRERDGDWPGRVQGHHRATSRAHHGAECGGPRDDGHGLSPALSG